MPLSCFGMFTSDKNDPIIGPISESSPSDTPQETGTFLLTLNLQLPCWLGELLNAVLVRKNLTSECKDRTQKGSTKMKEKKNSFFSLETSSSTVKMRESNQPWCNSEQRCHRGLCVRDLYSLKKEVFVLSFIW